MSLPAISTHPAVGRIMQPAIWSIVVLPEPDGPVIITTSPRRTVSLSFLRTCRIPCGSSYYLSTSWSRRTVSPGCLMCGMPPLGPC